jgi:hypothetical protein
MITKDDCLRRLIDNGFGDFWRRSSWSNSRANGSRCSGWGGRLRTIGGTFVSFAHRKVQRQKQRDNRKSNHHKRGTRFKCGSAKNKCFLYAIVAYRLLVDGIKPRRITC